jgi:hypothetical protein
VAVAPLRAHGRAIRDLQLGSHVTGPTLSEVEAARVPAVPTTDVAVVLARVPGAEARVHMDHTSTHSVSVFLAKLA